VRGVWKAGGRPPRRRWRGACPRAWWTRLGREGAAATPRGTFDRAIWVRRLGGLKPSSSMSRPDQQYWPLLLPFLPDIAGPRLRRPRCQFSNGAPDVTQPLTLQGKEPTLQGARN